MTCRSKDNLIRDDAGMSLIEVIVSLLILAVIVVPTLSMFVTAIRATEKANREMYAGNLARNVMEEVKFKGPGSVTAGGEYMTEGDEEFFVKVTLDEAGTEAVRSINEHRFGDVSDVARSTTLLLNPNEGVVSQSECVDEQAVTFFQNAWKGSDPIERDEVRGLVSRSLTISVNRTEQSSASLYTVTYLYRYTANNADNFTDTEWSFGVTDDSLTKRDLKLIYFLYTPWNAAADSGRLRLDASAENVTVSDSGMRTGDSEIPLYLVVQREKSYSGLTGSITLSQSGASKVSVVTEEGLYRAGGVSGATGVVKNDGVAKVHSYNVTVEVRRVQNGTPGEIVTTMTSTISD